MHVFNKKMVCSLVAAVLLGGGFLPQSAFAAKAPVSVQTAGDAAANPLLSREDPAKYAGFIWRIDSKDKDKLPRNFRTANSAYRTDADPKKAGEGFEANPSRKGLATLYASGSAEFSAKEFDKMVPVLKEQAKGPIYIVDLRQESHGLINGTAVSWYGERDWGNLGKSKRAALRDEKSRLESVRGKDVTMAKLGKDKKPVNPVTVKAESVMTEEQLVKSRGLRYFRIAATDHVWPSAENIDAFIRFTRKLPKDAWLHFHCQAGQGRTTAYMAMYDMMKNPDLSLGTILSRQYLIGNNYVAYRVAAPKDGDWKAAYYNQKADMVAKFYQYVQEQHADGFRMSWSKWLSQHLD
jgi:hypothetical protein